MMLSSRRKTLVTIAVTALITCLITTLTVIAATPTTTFSVFGGNYPGAPSYTVFTDGTNYFAKNDLGVIMYSGTDADTVLNSAFAAGDVEVFLTNGVYEIDDALSMDSYDALFGFSLKQNVGYTVPYEEGAVIKVADGADCNAIELAEDARYVEIKNLIIDCNSPEQTNTSLVGIWGGDYAAGNQIVGLTIENVGIYYPMSHFVSIGYGAVCRIQNNYMLFAGRNERQPLASASACGLYLLHYSDGWIINNDIEIIGWDADADEFIGTSGAGIWLQGGNNHIYGNNVGICTENAMYINGGQNWIQNNRLDNCGKHTLLLYESDNCIVECNDITTGGSLASNTYHLLNLVNCDNAILMANRIWDYNSPKNIKYGVNIDVNCNNCTAIGLNTQGASLNDIGIFDDGTGSHVNLCWNGTTWIS